MVPSCLRPSGPERTRAALGASDPWSLPRFNFINEGLDNTETVCYSKNAKGQQPRGRKGRGGQLRHPKGVKLMPITITLHIGKYTVTITVKSKDRHPAR